jgi:hypothetical protein
MEALGLITVERAPFNIRTHRYEPNQYRLAHEWQPLRAETHVDTGAQSDVGQGKGGGQKCEKIRRVKGAIF